MGLEVKMSKEPSELALKIGNKIADQFIAGFCDDRMVEDFARIVDEHLKPKPEQEPIYIVGKGWQCDEMPPEGVKLYTSPPKQKFLSDEKIAELWNTHHSGRNFALALAKEYGIGFDDEC